MVNCFVYRHIRTDNNTVFYVGIGSHKTKKNVHTRAYSKTGRNTYWHNIVNKTGFEVEIMLDNLTWEEACKKECEFISIYKRISENGTLCNMTIGGDGRAGIKHREETKEKMRAKALGKIISPEQRAKARVNSLGNKNTVGYKHNDDFKAKCRAVNTGKKMSEGAKIKIGNFWRGKQKSEEEKKKISKKLKGHKFTPEAKEKIRQTLLNSQPPIKQIDLNGDIIRVFKTSEEAATVLGRTIGSIRNSLRPLAQKRVPYRGYYLSRLAS